jgi:hypothetical protein
MARVISLRNVLHGRGEARMYRTARHERSRGTTELAFAASSSLNDEDIDRAIALLDAAASRAKLAVTQANDPSSAGDVEAQARSIVQLLGLARIVTSRI